MKTRAQAANVKFINGLLYTWQRELIPTPQEEDVFTALNMQFVPPTDRDDGRWAKYAKE